MCGELPRLWVSLLKTPRAGSHRLTDPLMGAVQVRDGYTS